VHAAEESNPVDDTKYGGYGGHYGGGHGGGYGGGHGGGYGGGHGGRGGGGGGRGGGFVTKRETMHVAEESNPVDDTKYGGYGGGHGGHGHGGPGGGHGGHGGGHMEAMEEAMDMEEGVVVVVVDVEEVASRKLKPNSTTRTH
jgi:hypothetical protein